MDTCVYPHVEWTFTGPFVFNLHEMSKCPSWCSINQFNFLARTPRTSVICCDRANVRWRSQLPSCKWYFVCVLHLHVLSSRNYFWSVLLCHLFYSTSSLIHPFPSDTFPFSFHFIGEIFGVFGAKKMFTIRVWATLVSNFNFNTSPGPTPCTTKQKNREVSRVQCPMSNVCSFRSPEGQSDRGDRWNVPSDERNLLFRVHRHRII